MFRKWYWEAPRAGLWRLRSRSSRSPLFFYAGCGSGGSGVDIEDASRHEAASATTPYRLACTDAGERTNFAYFSLGPKFAGFPVHDVLRRCIASATAHRTEPNDVAFVYGTCESEGDTGCAPPFQISSSPACQLNYSDYRPPRGVGHSHSGLRRWGHGAISVRVFDLGKLIVFTGKSTIEVSGAGSTGRQAGRILSRVRKESSGPRLEAPSDEIQNQIGVDSLPPPAPGALRDELRCDA